jgi:hypothetical protein
LDILYLSAVQVLILILGGIVVYYAFRAQGRTKSRAMLLLGLGFAFVTAGAAIAGALSVFISDLGTVESVQATFQAIGFFVIVYSLTRTKD